MALRLVELLVDRTAAQAAQLMIEYDPQPPFDNGSLAKCDDVIVHASHRVRRSCASSVWARQKVVAQNVSPRGSDASVLTSVSPHNAPSIPLTMPRSTAQITGCSIATSPNGQWLLTIRSWLLR